jgi:hypothetical protein
MSSGMNCEVVCSKKLAWTLWVARIEYGAQHHLYDHFVWWSCWARHYWCRPQGKVLVDASLLDSSVTDNCEEDWSNLIADGELRSTSISIKGKRELFLLVSEESSDIRKEKVSRWERRSAMTYQMHWVPSRASCSRTRCWSNRSIYWVEWRKEWA